MTTPTPAWTALLLGGFELHVHGAAGASFESRKVEGLFAYLLCHAGRTLSRDHLASLLWPDRPADSARRNLRQALYNLRSVLDGANGWRGLHADPQTVTLDLAGGGRLDVAEFEQALARGFHGQEPDLAELTRAARLYRGDFLQGFSVRGAEPFEEWLSTQRLRLRELAIQVEKTVADRHASRGDHTLAMQSAHRVLEMDPLSEPAHRDLMRLFAVSGRRTRALAQYEQLAQTLRRELGVEPDRRTREIYRAILAEEVPDTLLPHPSGPLGPVVPLVARGRAMLDLQASWEAMLGGGTRVAWVAGEAGVGKTRLVRTFLHQAAKRRQPEVLLGRCSPSGPLGSFEPFPELLRSAVAEQIPTRVDEPEQRLPELLAQIEELLPPAEPDERVDHPLARQVARLVRSLCRRTGRPLALFLDDLHRAPATTCELLAEILASLAGLPVWVVVTAADTDEPPELGVPVDRIRLRRLGEEACPAIAASLLGDAGGAGRLTAILRTHGEGLPLQIVETVNLLCDEGLLSPAADQRWSLSAEAVPEALPAVGLEPLLRRRVALLPSSARRLLALAAVVGRRFDLELLCRADHEHVAVVEIAIELSIERWLVRPFVRHWATHPRERDLVMWAHGARRGSFELAHPRLRDALYAELPAERRRELHRFVAQAYTAAAGEGDDDAWAEQRGHHWLCGGFPEAARGPLETAAANARRLGDEATAESFERKIEEGC